MSETNEDGFDPTAEINELLERFKPDYHKSSKGNVTAGKRARKLLQEIRAVCVTLRVRIINFRKEREKSKID